MFINNSANPITVNAAISSNVSQRMQLTKAGPGAVDFVGDVALGDNMFILDGTATFKGTNVLGVSYVTGGRLVFDAGSSNRLTGTMVVAGGEVSVLGRVHSSGEIYLGSVQGARSALYIDNDLYTTRWRIAHANEGNLTAGAAFQTNGIMLGFNASTGLTISDGVGNYGYYGLIGGVVSGDVVVAYRGPGLMEIRGGAVTPSNQFQVVNNTGYGVVNLFDGRFNAPGTPSGYIPFFGTANQGGRAVMNVMGGAMDAAYGGTNKPIDLMNQPGNTAYLNVLGGVVTANQVRALNAIGNSTLNFNGGTLVMAAGSAQSNAFIVGLSAAYIY